MLGRILTTPFDFEAAASNCFPHGSCGINCLDCCVNSRDSAALRTVAALGSSSGEMHYSGTYKSPSLSHLHQLTIVTAAPMASCNGLRYRPRSRRICIVILPNPRSSNGNEKQVHRPWGFWGSACVSQCNLVVPHSNPNLCL